MWTKETGCPWRHLPKDFPPKSTVHGYFDLWSWDGTLEHIHDVLYVRLREREGREASPSATIIDRQSAKACTKRGGVSVDPVGFDAGKKTKDVKRHVLTDHQGLLLSVAIHPASVQDGDGVKQVLTKRVRRRFPFIEVLRRCRIPGAQCSRDGAQVGRVADRDRQATRCTEGFRGHRQALDRRTNPGLDQP